MHSTIAELTNLERAYLNAIWQYHRDRSSSDKDVAISKEVFRLIKAGRLHSELSEALEEHRGGRKANETYYREDGKPEGIPSELADVVIRILDVCGYLNINLEAAIIEKMQFNESRPYRHGGKKL